MSRRGAVRAAAARVVLAVAYEGRTLDSALARELPAIDEARDRALLKSLSFESVRWFVRFDAAVGKLLDRPLRRRDAVVNALLVVGMVQIDRMRIPAHAAVAETVEAARRLRQPRAAGLVNAVLRRFQREHETLNSDLDADVASRYAVPEWLVETLRTNWPADWQRVIEQGNAHPPMWLRVNRRRTDADAYLRRLRDEIGADADTSAYAPSALCLAEPVDVRQLPGFADGDISVQDAAAQLATALLDVQPGMRVLDACAAPGGKTCALLESTPDNIDVTALDIDAARLAKVADNLERLKLSARLVEGDAGNPQSWWDGTAYQRILLDAPCTASGVIRRHPDIKLLRRPDDLDNLAAGQRRLLDALWPLLAPGGRLVYATCSVFDIENAAVVAAFVSNTDDAIVEPMLSNGVEWGRQCGPGRQILTGEAGMDGFYYACLVKRTRAPHSALQ